MSTNSLQDGWRVADPLQHPEWDQWLAKFPTATVFHTAAWTRVLTETYGHRPAFQAEFRNGYLASLLPVLEVASPVTGSRGVSLPFTDSCEPLLLAETDPAPLYQRTLEYGRSRHWRYFECRSRSAGWPEASPSISFLSHVLNLSDSFDSLFKQLDSAVRRGIRKAGDAGLRVEFRQDAEAVETFYRLHCGTRRRHGVPPQPNRFFRNIGRFVLEPGLGFVSLASTSGKTVAAAIFFHFSKTAIYKFGASDYRFQSLRPNNLLMWESIKRCADLGCSRLNFGRTSAANEGLRRFKLSFGASEQTLDYCKYDFRSGKFVLDHDLAEGWHNSIFRCLPAPLLRLAGKLLYPHLS